jgi:glycosyltransferase involved in cell wall biosynthesis
MGFPVTLTYPKCRILHIITGLGTGGAEMMLYKLLSGMNLKHSKPAVISLIPGGSLQASIEALGVPVHSLGMRRGIPSPTALWRLMLLVRHLRPLLVQGWMYHGNLVAQIAKSFLPRPVPILWNIRHSVYNLAYEKLLTQWLIRLGAKLSNRPEKIIYNSKVSAAQHKALGYASQNKVVISNGFDTGLFAPSEEIRLQVRRELGLFPSARVIGLIGRYHAQKNHPNFIRAAAHLSNSHADVHFLMAGRNVDVNNKELMDLIHDVKLIHKFHLLGERKDINTLMAGLDIASSSSSFGEGFPNVIGEAMACEVPCVVTDVGDSPLVVGETGIVVPPKNPLALANAWKELLDMGIEQRKNLGKLARERIISNYSLKSIASQYELLYSQFY